MRAVRCSGEPGPRLSCSDTPGLMSPSGTREHPHGELSPSYESGPECLCRPHERCEGTFSDYEPQHVFPCRALGSLLQVSRVWGARTEPSTPVAGWALVQLITKDEPVRAKHSQHTGHGCPPSRSLGATPEFSRSVAPPTPSAMVASRRCSRRRMSGPEDLPFPLLWSLLSHAR